MVNFLLMFRENLSGPIFKGRTDCPETSVMNYNYTGVLISPYPDQEGNKLRLSNV